ncbi:MAG: DNA circularization N-terminal domain-containing protein [Sphingomonas sp.]
MTAPAGWQKGSFRGVPFVTEENETSGGRRLVAHEFPQGEKPVLEDLGKKGARFTLNCHIIGVAYPAGADTLEDALETPGVGTLIHPWKGSMQVGVDSYSRRDSTSDGGIAVFSIEFLESGLPAVPAPTTDTAAIATATANGTADNAPANFASKFTVAGATAFVEQAASDVVKAAALATSIQAGLMGGIGPALRAFQSGFDALGGASALVRNGLDLGLATVGLVQTLSSLGNSGGARISAFMALLGFGDDLPPVDGTTPARELQRDNQAAIVQLVNLAAAGELVRAVATASFPSYQEAVTTRDAAADRLDRLAYRQADAGDDAGAAAYDDLRAALVRDVTARGGSLARLQDYTPAATEPALVIAYRLYGDPAQVEAQADEIVARNGVVHPGFVPGGQTLQVVTPANAIGAGNG